MKTRKRNNKQLDRIPNLTPDQLTVLERVVKLIIQVGLIFTAHIIFVVSAVLLIYAVKSFDQNMISYIMGALGLGGTGGAGRFLFPIYKHYFPSLTEK